MTLRAHTLTTLPSTTPLSQSVTDMDGVRDYVVALAAVLVDRVLADSDAHARAPQLLSVRFRHARQRSVARQQPCPAAVRAAALAHRKGGSGSGDPPPPHVEAARAAVVWAAMGLLRAELAAPFHLTLLGIGCAQFVGLGGAVGAAASSGAPAPVVPASAPPSADAAAAHSPSARARGRGEEEGVSATVGEGTPRKRQRGIAAYFSRA